MKIQDYEKKSGEFKVGDVVEVLHGDGLNKKKATIKKRVPTMFSLNAIATLEGEKENCILQWNGLHDCFCVYDPNERD